jgi:hypothetical protein
VNRTAAFIFNDTDASPRRRRRCWESPVTLDRSASAPQPSVRAAAAPRADMAHGAHGSLSSSISMRTPTAISSWYLKPDREIGPPSSPGFAVSTEGNPWVLDSLATTTGHVPFWRELRPRGMRSTRHVRLDRFRYPARLRTRGRAHAGLPGCHCRSSRQPCLLLSGGSAIAGGHVHHPACNLKALILLISFQHDGLEGSMWCPGKDSNLHGR